MLVLHYTDMPDTAAALDRLCDPEAAVSAHYLIAADGRVYQLVAEENRAWHAGESCWRGVRDVNSRSIGIELCNPGHSHGPAPYPPSQMAALLILAREILQRHAIPQRNVVGHSDIAPGRKRDPGEWFDWRWLAASGVGLWPEADSMAAEPARLPDLLAVIGYDIRDVPAAIAAFQRRYLRALMASRMP